MEFGRNTLALLYNLALAGPPEMFLIGPRRRKLIAPLQGLILEIGAGTGLSLQYYSAGTRLIATEPDLARVGRLRMKARESPASASVVAADAMKLPFPDDIFDGLVCNLALCTIPDPMMALAEVERVLRPGTPARFLEHVRASQPWLGAMQDRIAPLWYRLADGCRLNQDTESIIRQSALAVERVELKGGLLLPMKLIWARNA